MKMIDVGAKPKTERVAVARGFVRMSAKTVGIARRGESEKGDVLAAARLAGIMAAKRTPDLVPLCHPIALSGVEVEVRYAFSAHEDINDHAQVYVWHIYYWELIEGKAICRKHENFGGEYVAEADGLEGPFSMLSPLVSAAVARIQEARWNKKIIPPRTVGKPEE